MEEIKFLAGSEKRFFDFMSGLNKKDRIALLGHIDLDGICSAVLVSKVIGNPDYIDFLSYKQGMLKTVSEALKNKKINKIIMTDLSVEEQVESLRELEKFSDVLIVDHHNFRDDLNSNRITFLKADSKYPATYMCYYLLSKIQKLPAWIAALGIASDRPDAYYDEENGEKAANVFGDFNLGEKPSGLKLADYIRTGSRALIYFKGREKEVYDVFMRANDISDLKGLEKYCYEVEKEINECIADFEANHEEFGDLFYYYFKPKYAIKTAVINTLSVRDSGKTYVFVCESEGELSISARRQDGKVNLVELLKKLTSGFQAASGGHFCAAGATILPRDIGEFKERVRRLF